MTSASSNTTPKLVDGNLFKNLFRAALTWLETNEDAVNSQNVFPIPDGDTGVNMLKTMRSAWNEISELNSSSIGKVAKAAAHGAWMGGSGNSGVILSQILRGFAAAVEDLDQMGDADLAKALASARDTAYRGVGKPVEGTILTVIKDSAAAAEAYVEQADGARDMMEHVLEACKASVQHTPELLPVLKQAGVVDSGGFGLQVLFEGIVRYANGESLTEAVHTSFTPINIDEMGDVLDIIEPGQEWEVVVDFRPKRELNMQQFYTELETMGNSIQVGMGDELIKMHIHLLAVDRYRPIEYCETLGTVTNVAMENLLDQINQAEPNLADITVTEDQILAVSIAPGKGFAERMSDGAVSVLVGGQTMNPSVQEIKDAFADYPAQRVIILPNNKNIFMAALSAAETSDKEVRVLKTRSAAAAASALLQFNPDGDLDAVYAAMEEAIEDLGLGDLTYAVRDVEIDGVEVKEGQYIGLRNGKLAVSTDNLSDAMFELLETMDVEDCELMSMFYGQDVTADDAAQMVAAIEGRYDELEVELISGGQPHYQYIFSIE